MKKSTVTKIEQFAKTFYVFSIFLKMNGSFIPSFKEAFSYRNNPAKLHEWISLVEWSSIERKGII
jgi:hypothetical protein